MAQSQSSAVSQTGQSGQDESKNSPFAMGMSQLQQLANTNPAQFKEVTENISSQLSALAKKGTSPEQTKLLDGLSDKFAEASKSGSMASLEFHGGQHPNSGNASAASKYGSQNSGMSAAFSEVGSVITSAISSAQNSGAASPSTATAAISSVEASGGAAA
jgi:DNA-binding FadR family transcriptional regulator